jgi:6-phosphofructokinase 2
MIVTLTLNPCLDNYISVSGIEPNETTRSQRVLQYAGGKGINVSRAVNEMGGETVAFGLIGGEEGHILTSLLFAEGVPASFTPIEDETRACFIISDEKTAQQTRISPPGPRVKPEETRRLLQQIWQLKHKPDLLVCGGSVPPGIAEDIYITIINEAREHNIRTILDSSGAYLKHGVKARPYLIKPNVREAEELLGKKLSSEGEIVQAGMDIVGMGVEIAVISRAEKGLIAVGPDGIVKAVPPEVEVVSAVGAGDCTVAGLALELSAGSSMAEACRLAVAMGTAAVLSPGTGLAKRADVERLLKQVVVGKIGNRSGKSSLQSE